MNVIQKASSRHGIVRFETNRSFTGMGHERYFRGDEIHGHRPPDRLAAKLFETGQVDEVHVYAQTVTVVLAAGGSADGLADVIRDLYTYYLPGVEVPTEESFNV
ncbi:MAG: hypothetical protein R2710_17230 [Acidimicrobiales bacterium]